METIPNKVVLTECWGRDGLQNQPKYITVDEKLDMIEKIVDAGFKRVEVTSFSHPKYVPQFKDAELLLSRLKRQDGISYKATCVNKKALFRAIETVKLGYGPNEVSFVMAASEGYNQVNVRMNNQELLYQIDESIELAKTAGLEVLISISTAFGCPYQGEVTTNEILSLVKHFYEQGVDRISISDTTGLGNPKKSYELFSILRVNFPNMTFIAHFHDTKGWGIANAFAALQAGISYFDVSLGGIGGPPANRVKQQTGHTGNVCTEDFVYLLDDLNIYTGININKLVEVGYASEDLLGKQRSQVLHSLSK